MLSHLLTVLQSRPSPIAGAIAGASLLATGMSPPPQAKPLAAAVQPAGAAVQRASFAAPAARLVKLQDFSADEARLWNASLPASAAANPAALPFVLAQAGALSQARASDCLTAAVYYEAAHESLEGQQAVAQVVLNRLRHPAFPKTVCGVVFQGSERTTGCQFTFTCDGALARAPSALGWARARAVADAALAGYVERRVGHATHYHADYVSPYWSGELTKVATIGRHIFYRWNGGGGLPPTFVGAYAGGEDDRVAERVRPELITSVQVEIERAPTAAAEPEPVVEEVALSAAAPAAIQDVAAEVKVSAADLVALTPGEAYRARQERPQARTAMPSSLF